MKFWQWSLFLTLPALLSACATLPSPLAGNFPPITPHEAQSGTENGQSVRWGGEIIQTNPKATQTCFTVLGYPLHADGRPKLRQQASDQGRFLACAPGFYDPTIYAAGREVTFIGTITGVQKQKVGAYEYPYPTIEASKVYLWPMPRPRPAETSVFINGGWGWGGPGWGWGWWGYPY